MYMCDILYTINLPLLQNKSQKKHAFHTNPTLRLFILLQDYIIEKYTKILEVNLFAFAYRLFRRDFSPLDGTYCMGTHSFLQPYIHTKCI